MVAASEPPVIIRCTKCSTEFALDPSQVGPEGVTLRCSVCSHMFHAEPDPEAMPAPWKLATADRQVFTLPDLRRVLEQVEDGRLRPDDQISHTGQTWLRLGEMPEFSSLFIGAEGLPRVFKAIESHAAAVETAPPPPAYGSAVDELRREETVRFNIHAIAGTASAGARAPARPPEEAPAPAPVPAPPDYDSPLPAPPDYDSPVSRRGRAPGVPEPRSFAEPKPAKKAPASMLEAVTKAVAGEEPAADAPEAEASKVRSQPILVADLARAAAAHAEKTVQAVDRERAREREASMQASTRSLSETGRSLSDTGKVATAAAVAAAMAAANRPGELRPGAGERATSSMPQQRPKTGPLPTVGRTGTGSLPAVGEPPRAGTGPLPAQRTGTGSLPAVGEPPRAGTGPLPAQTPAAPLTIPPGALQADASLAAASAARPPEVVIVKVTEPAPRSSALLYGLLGMAAAAALVFGVPSIREKLFSLGQPAPVTRADPAKAAPAEVPPTQELQQARTAIHKLGLKDTDRGQAALQRVLDDKQRGPQAVAQAQLALAELVLMRALACQIAVALEPAAMGGQAQARSTEDPPAAQDLLGGLGEPPDEVQLRRVKALQALVRGETPGELPPDSEELAALVKAAPLWRGQVRTPPTGLITALSRLPRPSTLSESVLALALWRSGDEARARELLTRIVAQVPDQPVARTLLDLLDRQGIVAENGDPEAATPPPNDTAADGGETPPEPPRTPTPPEPGKAPTKAEEPPAGERVEVLVSTGCQKVRHGDPMGVKLLLDAVARGANPMDNFNLCFCLGAGFARQNSHDTALTWYARAVKQSPTNRDAVAGAARSAELLGRTATAVDYYKKLRALDPENAAAHAYLAKHEGGGGEPTPPPTETPGELLPVKRKNP
jgi:predicted Zn finger-like uncharacterized protein